MLKHEQLTELRRLANKAVPSAEWFLSQHLNEVPFIDGAAAKFIVAANPEAILHMLHHIDAQQARISELTLKSESLQQSLHLLMDKAVEMEQEAARYRWLRDVSVPPHNFYISVPDEFAGVRYMQTEVDAYIDAAMQKGKTT